MNDGTTDQATQAAWLQQFLRWTIPCDLGFALMQAVAAWLSSDPVTALTATITLGYGLVLMVAYRLTQQGRQRAAVTAICAGMLGAALLLTLLRPALAFAIVVVPLLVVTIALPYVSHRGLRRLTWTCWLAAVLILVLGQFLPQAAEPLSGFVLVFRMSALGTVIGLILLLLSQFNQRLTGMLQRTRAAEERYSLAAQGANDGLWDWDLLRNRVYYSPRWKAMLGYAEQAIGDSPQEWLERIHPDDQARVHAELAVHLQGLTPHFESEHRMRDGRGHYQWMLVRGVAIRDGAGRAIRMAGSQTDITPRKQIEAQLRHAALHDALTGLPNRVLLMERLEQALARAKQTPNGRFALLFLDLDRFKVINDSLGHTLGDELLIAVVARLTAVCQPHLLARLGGDEFTILYDRLQDVAEVGALAERIHAALSAPLLLDDLEVFISVSIGIVVSHERYTRPEELLRDADIALYHAKATGRARSALFDQQMHQHALRRLRLEADLRRAVERREFCVVYQPIVRLPTGQISGFEALVRWRHPQRGLLPPGEFLAVAEETGLLAEISWWVLAEACAQMRAWQCATGNERVALNVNLCAAQCAHPDLVQRVRAALEQSGLPPATLHLEITEGVMMETSNLAPEALADLRALGVKLQIDDFGTGYSSLGALQRLPIDALKIDRSFIANLAPRHGSRQLVEAITSLAHTLGMEVIAEGIETEQQLAVLQAIACDFGQGYLFAKPLLAEEACALLMARRPLAGTNRMPSGPSSTADAQITTPRAA